MAVPMMPVPAPVTPVPMPVMPAPVAAMPMSVPVMMAPAHLLRLETIDIVLTGNRRRRIFAAGRHEILRRGNRRQRRSLRARRQRSSASGKANGEFQKVTAFHDILLPGW